MGESFFVDIELPDSCAQKPYQECAVIQEVKTCCFPWFNGMVSVVFF